MAEVVARVEVNAVPAGLHTEVDREYRYLQACDKDGTHGEADLATQAVRAVDVRQPRVASGRQVRAEADDNSVSVIA